MSEQSGLIIRFAGKRTSSRWNDYAGKLAGRPKVNRSTEVERLVQTATLDIERARVPTTLMPQTRAANGAERAVKRMSRCGSARPVAWCALQKLKSVSRYRKRDSEGGGRLLPAFGAVAHMDHQRLFRHGIANAAALATAKLPASTQRHRRIRRHRCCPLLAYVLDATRYDYP